MERAHGFIKACVRFRIPLDNSRRVFENVEVTGVQCLEVWEAESSAAIRALAQLENAPFHICILDVSRLRCEEMERNCYWHLHKTGEACRAAKILLSDWEDTMLKTELCYKSLYGEVMDSVHRQAIGIGVYDEISCDVADSIYELNKNSYLELVKLAAEVEEIKYNEWDVHSEADHHFHGRCHNRPKTHLPCLPCEMKLCMKRILDEMVTSLGWDKPVIKFTSPETDQYDCNVLLLAKTRGTGTVIMKTMVANGQGSTGAESIETACQNAISMLESEMSIYLTDMNYNRRSQGELCVSEAKQVANLAIASCTKIVVEWEKLVDGLQACEKKCWDAVANHPEKEPWNPSYNTKCDCAGAVADLHGACLSDLVFAKERHTALSNLVDKQMHG